jgi:hypothetical protein
VENPEEGSEQILFSSTESLKRVASSVLSIKGFRVKPSLLYFMQAGIRIEIIDLGGGSISSLVSGIR